MATGISNQGRASESLFMELVPGSTRATSTSMGDASVVVDGQETAVEIKKCDSSTNGTINQIRAIKFIPMVVHNPSRNCWYVVPATELVRYAIAKKRGQHTEISFESMNLSLSQISHFRCTSERLADALVEAIRFDWQHEALRQQMATLLRQLQTLATTSRDAAAALLDSIPKWRVDEAE
jgi:hypothetical protein